MAKDEKPVTLSNKGQRIIEIGGVSFAPGETAEFPAEHAARLKRLYPTDIHDLAETKKPFADAKKSKEDPQPETPASDSGENTEVDPQTEKKAKAAAAALLREAKKAGFETVEEYQEYLKLEAEEKESDEKPAV